MVYTLIATAILFLSQAHAQMRMPILPRTPEEARATVEARRQAVFAEYAALPMVPMPSFPQHGTHEFATRGLSKLALKVDLESVSQTLLDPNFKPWLPGTEITVAGPLCRRKGDYDFTLITLVHMAYLDQREGETLLSPEARAHLIHDLLTPRGAKPYTSFKLDHCIPLLRIHDTENHILMTNATRLLTNQLLAKEERNKGAEVSAEYDNEANGTNAWMVKHLSQFLYHDFDELNSRPYQGHSIAPIALLATYAESEKVRTGARLVLDYLSAKYAVQSMGLRRYNPFRRRRENREPVNFAHHESGISWYSFHAGNHDFTAIAERAGRSDVSIEDRFFIYAALDTYQVPDEVMKVFYHQDSYFQRIMARDPEIYYATPTYLLTAGGRHRSVFGYFTGENDVWAVSTNLIGRSEGLGYTDLFRIQGPDNWNKRNNLCVAPNFACGTNFKVPDAYRNLGVTVGSWTFYQTPDFNLAVFREGKFVLWEVQAPGELAAFQTAVLRNNARGFQPKGPNTYLTVDGHRVEFDWGVKKKGQSPILSYDQVAVEPDTKKWKFAEGDVLESSGDGLIKIKSLDSQGVIELDYRDVANPKRSQR